MSGKLEVQLNASAAGSVELFAIALFPPQPTIAKADHSAIPIPHFFSLINIFLFFLLAVWGAGSAFPAIRRSLSQKKRQKYTLKCVAAGPDGLIEKFCTDRIGTCADFAIGRLKVRRAIPRPPVCRRPRRTRVPGIAVSMRISAPLYDLHHSR
ncbi:hypothetical protein [Duganella sp. Root1480D1]|uniref:hypothetical protein n=1 Tax=Duganella sp. Root1480D1 TaxID=1736471 RepID=UPI00138F4FCF|nr:hypothetical protein [Duganella sp. Root1480D1]